ncbi:MAG: hypothetical protein HYZ73_05510 [Elusimicrobia bacterium]|nr:hypothetical protein [Elusimicrobiota bacterium]
MLIGALSLLAASAPQAALEAATTELALTTNSANQEAPAIDGDKVIWRDYRDGQPDIYLYDIATGQERRVTFTSASESCMAIQGSRIIWIDQRTGAWLPYVYDLTTNTERAIPVGAAGVWNCPWMDGDRVVWISSNTSRDVYLYNLSANTSQQLPIPSTNDRTNLRLYGDRLVREDWNNPGPWHLFVYNLVTGTDQRVGTTNAKQEFPWLWQDRVVVHEYRQGEPPTGFADVYSYNLTTGTETQLTSGPAQQDLAAIFGNRIVWRDNRNSGNGYVDLYLYDLSTGTEQRITTTPRSITGHWLWNDRIVWSDNRSGNYDIYLVDLQPDPGVPMHELARGNEVFNFVNFPWGKYFNSAQGGFVYTYGMDFGFCPLTDARRVVNNPQISQDLDTLRSAGVEGIRWFLIPDGRNLTFDASRTPTGRGAGFKDDLWAAMDLLESRGMSGIFTLIDGNTWFKPEGTYQGAFFGHARVITDPVKRQTLYNAVIIPTLQELLAWQTANPTRRFPIAAVDLGNELLFGTNAYQGTGATIADMQTYVREVATLIHQYLPRVPVTVGATDAQDLVDHWTDAALGTLAGQGLDFYSFHHYGPEPLQGPNGLRARFALDQLGKRIYLQEFPGKNAPLGGPEMYLAPIGGKRGTRLGEGWLSGSYLWSVNGAADGATPDDPVGVLQQVDAWLTTAFDKPDLRISDIFYPMPLGAGSPVSFQFTIVNQGGVTASTNRFEAFLDGNALGYQILPAIAPGDSTTAALPTTPWIATEGTHALWSKADVWLSVTEANENNNEATRVVVVGPARPDLVIDSVSLPSSITEGDAVQWTITVKNQGAAAAGANRLELWLDGAKLATAMVPALGVGSSTTVSVPSPPWIATVGSHSYWTKADVWLEVSEADENNNERTSPFTVQPKPAGPDLVMTDLSGPVSGLSGAPITVTSTVTNQGNAATNSFSVGFYLSSDPTITTGDTRIGTRSVSSLAAGASSRTQTTLTIPSRVSPHTYYLGAIADYTNVRTETNETNNAITGNIIAVSPGADLVMTALSGPSRATRGSTITIANSVANQGVGSAASFSVGLYLSTDAVMTTSDTRIGTRSVNNLAAGASSSANTSVTLSNRLNARTYYLGAIADYTSKRPESNETNNTLTGNTIAIQ